MTFYTSVRLLTLKQYEICHTNDISCVKVREKYHCSQEEYSDAKDEYFQSQCSKCKHQWKLKKNLKYIDKLFRSYKCLYISWDLYQPLILFFSNGCIVNIKLNDENNTLLAIDIDETLCGKFFQSRIVDVVVCKNYIYVTYADPKLTLIHINQDSPPLLAKMFGRKKGKVVGFEPKFLHFDLSSHSAKSIERKISLNIQKDLLLIWWQNSSDDVWPWTPLTYLANRVNMLIYSVNESNVELLYKIKVQDDILYATFSKEHSSKFFCLEEAKTGDEIIVSFHIYEIVPGQCQLLHTAKLPLNGSLIAFDWSSTQDKLLLADSSGFLLIYDVRTLSSIANFTKLKCLPQHVSWHPQSCIALIVCKNNHVLCVDAALNPIDFKLCYNTLSQLNVIELDSFFSVKFSVQKIMWQKSPLHDTCLLLIDSQLSSFILLKFSFGSITRHNITSLELVSQYLKCNMFDRANLILMSLNWSSNSDIKFQCLSKIVNHLLRKPLSFETQACLEYALKSFYHDIQTMQRKVVKKYGHRIHHLSRRFFHRLLRYHKFRKAFLLALDLHSQDLFLDLYHVAKEKGENILAAVALRKADEFDVTCDSYSESSLSESSLESTTSSYHEIDYSSLMPKRYLDIPLETPNTIISCASTKTGNTECSSSVISEQSSYDFSQNYGSTSTSYEHSSMPLNYPEVCHHENNSHLEPSLYHLSSDHSFDSSTSAREPNVHPHSSYIFNAENKIWDFQHSQFDTKAQENCVIEEDSEEMEGARITLAHLGII